MYPIGVLFGLGFDTAIEVALLVLAGGAAAYALPWFAILTRAGVDPDTEALLDVAIDRRFEDDLTPANDHGPAQPCHWAERTQQARHSATYVMLVAHSASCCQHQGA